MSLLSDFDECECGDYRRQHAEGWRECVICVEEDPMNGRKCLMFRPMRVARMTWEMAR